MKESMLCLAASLIMGGAAFAYHECGTDMPVYVGYS